MPSSFVIRGHKVGQIKPCSGCMHLNGQNNRRGLKGDFEDSFLPCGHDAQCTTVSNAIGCKFRDFQRIECARKFCRGYAPLIFRARPFRSKRIKNSIRQYPPLISFLDGLRYFSSNKNFLNIRKQ